jgi:hypothetical protein
MVKMAVYSAWAELQIASADQTYLVDVLKPHIAKLTPLWLASLREYARLRFEPDISSSMGSASLSGSLDTIYAALNRETLLKVSLRDTRPHVANCQTVLPRFMAQSRRCHRQSHRRGQRVRLRCLGWQNRIVRIDIERKGG